MSGLPGQRVLVRPGGTVAVGADGKVRIGLDGSPCCCDPCAPYIRAAWCCGQSRVAWLWMNDPACPGHIPGQLVVPRDRSIIISHDGTCYRTEPDSILEFSQLPDDAVLLGGTSVPFEVGSCLATACRECPECCGSTDPRWAWPLCGFRREDGTPITCCECGDDYVLRISSLSTSVRRNWVIKPCTLYPYPLLGPFHAYTQQTRYEAQFHFGCRLLPNGTRQRVVTPIEIDGTIRRVEGGVAVWYTTTTQGCPISHIEEVVVSDETTRYDRLYSGTEGCGLRRDNADVLRNLSVQQASGAMGRFDVLGQCEGTFEFVRDCRTPEEGGTGGPITGDDVWLCDHGVPRTQRFAWQGAQSCSGGNFSASGMERNYGSVRGFGYANGATTPTEGPWLGYSETEWSHTQAWSVVGGTPCSQPPCQAQSPQSLSKATVAHISGVVGEAVRSGGHAQRGPRDTLVPGVGARADEVLRAALAGPWGSACGGCGR